MIIQHYAIRAEDYLNAGKASSQIKQLLKKIGIDAERLRRMSVACYEAEINMVIHSFGGEITIKVEEDRIQMQFKDCGPGIEDIQKAMEPGWSTASDKAREMGFGAGMGLVNIQKMADVFELKTSRDGTILCLVFFIS